MLRAVLAVSAAGACNKQSSGSKEAASSTAMPTLQPQELASMLSQAGDHGAKPLLLHVGFKKLYQQAHIPGSEYFGPGSEADVIEHLRKRVADLPRDTSIVVYCGCCPWERCPNVKPAYEALQALGFKRLQVLHIAEDFGTDWVAKGYPVAKGD